MLLVCAVVAGAGASLFFAQGSPSREWAHFFAYLVAILLSSGMKVAMPTSDGTMSVNFPFILLGIVQLSPIQAVALAISSVIAQSRLHKIKAMGAIKALFNVANVTTATVLACLAYAASLRVVHHEVAPALAIGSTVYFVANTVPVGLILASESNTPFLRQWWQEFPWYFPFYIVGAILAATADFIGIKFGWLTSMLLIPMVYTVYRAYSAQMAIIRDREQYILDTEALHMRTIEGLAMAIEAKDKNTHRHLLRVRVYVSELGKSMGLNEGQMKALITASYLHDIGKLAVPEHILNKPGKLTPQEFEKMKIHTVVGAEILQRVRFPYPVVPIVRSHHEAWDGSGYPDGLRGEEIPIGARILTAVDAFDALASERPYRRALPIGEAMEILKRKAGTQFDPGVVKQLEERYVELEALASQYLGEMPPLNTDLFIVRGAAPAAGFAMEAGEGDGALMNSLDGPSDMGWRDGRSKAAAAGEEVRALLRELANTLTPAEATTALARQIQTMVPCDCLAVYLKDDGMLRPHYVGGRYADAFLQTPFPIGQGLSGWVAESRRAIVNGNPTVEPNLRNGHGTFTPDSSVISIPLSDTNGALLGVLSVYSRGQNAYSTEHLHVLQQVQPRFSSLLRSAARADLPVMEGSSL
ncbi:MAG TPA: HD domain-containing phosphohydrolase [Terracidiphilus sp.]|nr:HD domain-containing phosphohydrolase [Terracidiphilus sp.]